MYNSSEDLLHNDLFGNTLRQELENYGAWGKTGTSHVFLNNVLLKHFNKVHLLVCGLSCCVVELSSCDRLHVHKPKVFSLPASALGQSTQVRSEIICGTLR